MATTLSITLDDDAAAAAQRIAERQGTDIGSMIARLFRLMADHEKSFDSSLLPPITRSALGLAKGMPNKPYKELLADALVAKYESLK